jgi:hypothetical protein
MPLAPRSHGALALFLLAALVPAAVPEARAAIVISEFAHRGPSAALDEFVELYNTGDNAVDISGYKLQYKQASGGAFSDRATLPANSIIPGRGFFLIASTGYVGSPAADYVSGDWTSGMADNGHARILNAFSVEVDKVGWGSADSPEGAAAPSHGASANNNSVERKANGSSTAALLATGGAHELLGNGQDTNNNANDFVLQSNGRRPQNSANSPEPAFASGGNGTGVVGIQPATANATRSASSTRSSCRSSRTPPTRSPGSRSRCRRRSAGPIRSLRSS